MTMKNLECPRCHSRGPFWVSATVITLIDRGGLVRADMDSIEYEDDDLCTCNKCDHADDLKTFKIKAK